MLQNTFCGMGCWSLIISILKPYRNANIWPTPAGKMDVVEYVLWSRMWAIQQYARPSIHQELSGMLPSIHTSCNTYTLNINTYFFLSFIIFISIFYWIPLGHCDQITFPFHLICSICEMSWISVQNFTLHWLSFCHLERAAKV